MAIYGISLFSGAGGLDVGAESAGVTITDCVEHDKDSVETLRLNNKSKKKAIHEADITAFDFRPLKKNKTQIVMGGPPCQPFSKNGYWVRNENRKVALDPRNLLDQFMRSLEEISPKGFLFENVDSILHPTNKPSLDRFLDMAAALGYGTKVYRSYALDFGAPQKRKRVFVFGVRHEKGILPEPLVTHKNPDNKYLFDSNLPDYPSVGTFISRFAGPEFHEPYEDASSGTYYPELCAVIPGKNYMSLTDLKNYSGKTFEHGKRFWNFLFKLSPSEPSITIAAQPGPWVGPFHWTNRRLRVPEIAAIQTFPENYKFAGNRRSVQKQIGNAVPCLLGQRMLEHLLSLIE